MVGSSVGHSKHPQSCRIGVHGHWTVGWSDIALFAIFENVHIAADQVYIYMSSFSKHHRGP